MDIQLKRGLLDVCVLKAISGKDSYGYGYFAYIEDGELVVGENWPHEGGVHFRGPVSDASRALTYLMNEQKHRPSYDINRLNNEVFDYYKKSLASEEEQQQLKKKYSFDEETKTILFKVKLHMDDGHTIHSVLVRGRFQADVIKKLFPVNAEVLTLQTYNGDVFAVRSNRISAAEFVED